VRRNTTESFAVVRGHGEVEIGKGADALNRRFELADRCSKRGLRVPPHVARRVCTRFSVPASKHFPTRLCGNRNAIGGPDVSEPTQSIGSKILTRAP